MQSEADWDDSLFNRLLIKKSVAWIVPGWVIAAAVVPAWVVPATVVPAAVVSAAVVPVADVPTAVVPSLVIPATVVPAAVVCTERPVKILFLVKSLVKSQSSLQKSTLFNL